VSAREIEQRIIRPQALARRLAFGGIATALRERGIRQVAVDHETVTLQRLDGELEPPGSGRPIDISRPCHDAALPTQFNQREPIGGRQRYKRHPPRAMAAAARVTCTPTSVQ